MFTLTEKHLSKLCEQNSFEIDRSVMVFFGLRGCLPVDDTNHTFRTEHQLQSVNINHVNPRCTLIQWKPDKGEFAVFPGSTVPNRKYVGTALNSGGAGANQMLTGYYKDFRKGKHKPGGPTSHDAFRETSGRPIRRTADDYDYDNDDRVEFANPNDNMHAAWCQSVDSESFASAGCQVIVGYPKCEKRGANPAIGPWKDFKENAYSIDQNSFPYVLLNGRDAFKMAAMGSGKITARLRFGSSGKLVEELQKLLGDNNFYEGEIDGDFGRRTIKAFLEYQTSIFGDSEDDGIVGPNSASSIGLKLPEIIL